MNKSRKQRKDSFFGVHFDFHAREKTHPVGKTPRPDIIGQMLDEVQPDYMQCDTKGHPGLSSYPTKVGNAVSGISCDNLKMVRQLTAERGIALYGHYSGLYDQRAATDHPDWAVVSPEGVVSREILSVFGPYCDQLLIPQLKELALDYQLDGAWVDGDCWATQVDYSHHAKEAYRAQTGRDPAYPGEPGYEDYREFCRKGFRAYVTHYVEEVKRVAPNFQIASNWLCSAQDPEPVTIPVDFLSGDYDPVNSYYSARTHARCLMNQGIPWDLMAWGQNAPYYWTTDNRNTKEAVQYCQEAAVVLALGGGFQFFNHQYEGGCLVQAWAIPIWRSVAQFCRARQPFCFQAQAVPQVGIVYSRLAHEHSGERLMSCASQVYARVQGLVNLCADCQIPSEVLLSHQVLERDLAQLGTILVPDSTLLEPELLEALAEYAADGGSLVLCGPDIARLFEDRFGYSMGPTAQRLTYLAFERRMAAFEDARASFEELGAGEVTGLLHDYNYFESPEYPMSIALTTGRGQVGVLGFDLGHVYQSNRTTTLRDYFKNQMDRFFPQRLVTVTGSMYVDLTVMHKQDQLMINLVNSAGPHSDPNVRSYSEVPAIGPLQVSIALERAPQCVTLEPEGQALDFEYRDGRVWLTLDRLDLHAILVVDP